MQQVTAILNAFLTDTKSKCSEFVAVDDGKCVGDDTETGGDLLGGKIVSDMFFY